MIFSSLSKFMSITFTYTPLFNNLVVNYFLSDTYACSSSKLQNLYDVPSISGDDVLNFDPARPIVELPQRVRNTPSYLHDFHCYYTMFHIMYHSHINKPLHIHIGSKL